MDGSFDPSDLRAWPLSGGQLAVAFGEDELPPDVASLDIGSLVSRAVGSLSLEKTAAIESLPHVEPVSLATIWRHPEAHPAVLLLITLDRYGEGSLEWMPTTLRLTLDRDGSAPSNTNFTKLLAARTLLTTPSPWRQWEVFHWVARGLAGLAPSFSYLEEPELGHLFVMADLMHFADPARKTGIEVDKFVAAVFRTEGVHYAPEPLGFAQREIGQPQIHCRKCSATHRDDHDVKCISCGSPDLARIPSEFEASRSATQKLWDVRKTQPIATSLDNLPDTGVGNAVYRLLVGWGYARHARAQMIQQLRMISGTR